MNNNVASIGFRKGRCIYQKKSFVLPDNVHLLQYECNFHVEYKLVAKDEVEMI